MTETQHISSDTNGGVGETGGGGGAGGGDGGMSGWVGVVIVDHGSRRVESNAMLESFVELFAANTDYGIVEPAHMELAEPSIATAFDRCVERGATRVIVMPYFLLPGRHWDQDIPALTDQAAKKHPQVSFVVGAPIGLHEQMTDVIASRLDHCLAHVDGDAPECNVCAGTDRCRLRRGG